MSRYPSKASCPTVQVQCLYHHSSPQTFPILRPNEYKHVLGFVALEVLLTPLASRLSQSLAALRPSLIPAITRAILRNSQNHTVLELLSRFIGRMAAVVVAVTELGLGPVAAHAAVDTVVVGWVEGGGGAGSRDGRASGGRVGGGGTPGHWEWRQGDGRDGHC